MKLIFSFRLFLSIILFFSFCLCNAQINIELIEADKNLVKSDSLSKRSQHNKSLNSLKKASTIYKYYKKWDKYGSAQNKIAENYYYLSNYKKAEQILESLFKSNYVSDTIKAISYRNFAKVKNVYGKYDLAIQYVEKGLKIQEKTLHESNKEIAYSLLTLGGFLRSVSKYNQAIENLNRAFKIIKKSPLENELEIALYHLLMGKCFSSKGKFDESIESFNKALKIVANKYPRFHQSILGSLGHVYYNKEQNLEKSLFYRKNRLAIIEKFLPKSGIEEAYAYKGLGFVYSSLGKNDIAYNHYKKALEIYDELSLKDNVNLMGGIYLDMYFINFDRGNYEKALEFLDKRLQGYIDMVGPNNYGVAHTYVLYANYYERTENYDLAIRNNNKALQIFNKVFKEDHFMKGVVMRDLGRLYVLKEDALKAKRWLQKAADLFENLYGKINTYNTGVYFSMAESEANQENYHSAINFLDKATAANLDVRHRYNSINEESSFIDNYYQMYFSDFKASILTKRFYKEENLNDLSRALTNYKLCDSLINQSLKSDTDKKRRFLSHLYFYGNAIDVAKTLYDKTKDSMYLKDGFYFSEKNKAILLDDQLYSHYYKKNSGISKSFLEKEEKVSNNIATLESKLFNLKFKSKKKDTSRILQTEENLINLYRSKDSIIKTIENKYPKYYQLKYDNSIISIKEIQNNLSESTTLLEYFVRDSVVYAFTINQNDFGLTQLEVSNLNEDIKHFKSLIINKKSVDYTKMGYDLYCKLIKPVKDKLKGDELIIVPDGALWHLNFDVLLTKQTSSEGYKELPYFLKEKVISYANSANLLFNPIYDDKKGNIEECLAFSFADTTVVDQGSTMDLAVLRNTDDDLPGTREEIKAISEIINGKYYYGKEAIEDNFKSNAANYNILHLALHGEVDNEHPENSRLFFTKNKDTLQDNYLYNHELYAMDIPAELVVLSACNTGSGKVAKGEGIMSLGRAFQYAGAKSLVLTNWEVSDETTPILMKNFYANLKQGMNKAKALQQAKLQYLHTANIYNTDPFYWGGFYLIGETTPIDFKNNLSLWYWVGFIGLVLIFIGIVYRKRMKR